MTPEVQALPREGRREASTLELLRRRYGSNYITVERLLLDHLPHIGTEKHLRTEIREGRIDLPLSRLHDSARAPLIVYLSHLAAFLDRAEQDATKVA